MATNSISCPLCDGPAAVKRRGGSRITHVTCTGFCRNEFFISNTAMRVLGSSEGAERRGKVRRVVPCRLPERKIHVVAWSIAHDDAELSVESRDAWMQR